MRLQRGALWNKWDLHVHTPLSLVQQYGGDTPAAWDRFFGDLEALPPEFKVLGINDYIFIDGYERVLAAKRSGRLSNIDLLLPVIELRIDKFGGTQGDLSRVNLHIIFSDAVPSDVIQAQFLNALATHYQLDPAYEAVKSIWQAVPTRESLVDLGIKIRESVPDEKKVHFTSPLRDGFNALNFNFDSVLAVLNKHYFKDKVLTAVGKTEWSSIQWNEGSVADKKTIINKVDLVFTSAATANDCLQARTALRTACVNDRLLDCSDAHHFSDSAEKDRIGKCFTWINADTEFDGLRQAHKEPEGRIFLGLEPAARQRLRTNKTKYIARLVIRKTFDATSPEPWFDGATLDLNPGFVAVIGNKGSGKSALVDILGLLGNSHRHRYASFLTADRFCDPNDNKAESFEAEMLWESGESSVRKLSDDIDETDVERVTYVPQNVFEEICNELQGAERGKFDSELKGVIFSHVPLADRLGRSALDELLEYRTRELNLAAEQRRTALSELNREIIALERQTTSEHRQSLENLLLQRKSELAAHDATRPVAVAAPSEGPTAEEAQLLASMNSLQGELGTLANDITAKEERRSALARELAALDRISQRLTNLRESFEEFSRVTSAELEPFGLSVSDFVQLEVNDGILAAQRGPRQGELDAVTAKLDPASPQSLPNRRAQAERKIADIQARLNEPQARYQEYLAAESGWDKRRAQIIGTQSDVDSIAHIEKTIDDLKLLPGRLGDLSEKRRELSREIHGCLKRIAELYGRVYEPVQQFITRHPAAGETFQLRFGVSIADSGFEENFLDWINRARVGSFLGNDQAAQRVREAVAHHDFNDEASTVAFADSILDQLKYDRRSGTGSPVRVADQLRTGKSEESLLDFLFGLQYLQPRYDLKMGDRELHQLSPGEKGALLLVFYLLVDQNDNPLVIDQPEENLDNQTIVKLLVPSLKEAKQRRQIFIVTHNPNLAVVCDAEQVICALRDSHAEPRIRYQAGAIENPSINRRIVDVLEGTRPAFDNRGGKYHQ